jgi:protein SCO1/2
VRGSWRVATLLAAALVPVLAGCGGSGAAATGGGRYAVADPLPPGLSGRPAARIRLADGRGGGFDTRSLAGTPYLVTFLYTNCPDVCPLIGEEIAQALRVLGPDARRVAIVAVTVDPRHDTRQAVQVWLKRHREPSQFHYLIGSEAQLAPIWKAWYAAPQIAGDPESAHTAVVWLVDGRGRLVAKVSAGVAFSPSGLAHDIRTLLPS